MQPLRLTIPENVKIAYILFVILGSIDLWSFQVLDESKYTLLEAMVCFSLPVIVLYNLNIFLKKGLRFKTNVLLFLFLPLLSAIGAGIYHGQPIGLSLMLLRIFLGWLFYFVLHIFDLPTQKVIKILLFVGFVWIFLTVVQQFTYPHYYFYTRSDKDGYEILRAGTYRYFIAGYYYGLLLLFYFFYKYLTEKKTYYLFFVMFGLIGFYYYGTRQVAVAAVACMFLATFLLQGLSKWKYFLLFSTCFFIFILFGSFLFNDIIEMTQSQMDDDNYVRFIAAEFFLNEYWPHWGAKLLGNGIPHELAAYGREMKYLSTYLHLYRSDVGIIGTYNEMGIFFILNIIWTNLRGIFMKFYNNETKFLKLFFFYFSFIAVLSQGYTSLDEIPFYCVIYYMIDKSFQEENSKGNVLNRVVDLKRVKSLYKEEVGEAKVYS